MIRFKVGNKPIRMSVERVAVIGEGAYERGYEQGYNKGYSAGLSDGKTDGYNEGYNKGATDGEATGYDKGYSEGFNKGYSDGYIKGKEDGITEGFEAGRKAEYKAFWDVFLRKDATDYSYRFAGTGWTDSTFNPAADIIPLYGSANYLFCNSRITDIDAILKKNNVILDVSKVNNLGYLFGYCKETVCVPETVIGNDCTTIGYMFNGCVALHTIKKLVFPNKPGINVNRAFYDCTALVNLTVGGTIAVTDIDLHWSTLLSRESITSVINALSDATTGMTITLSKTAVEAAFTAEEWSALVATKPNWTISLV